MARLCWGCLAKTGDNMNEELNKKMIELFPAANRATEIYRRCLDFHREVAEEFGAENLPPYLMIDMVIRARDEANAAWKALYVAIGIPPEMYLEVT